MNTQDVEPQFEEALKTKEKLVVLFYASWCSFSQRFLPIYQRCTVNNPTPCIRVKVDDREDLCEKYSIAVFPTVLLFDKGEVAERLDGEPGEGLSEKQLRKLLETY
jgi:thiol-disulfide isomerase/thioredoxin